MDNFYKSYMNNCNKNLIKRFWSSSNTKDYLEFVTDYGHTVRYEKTIFGEMQITRIIHRESHIIIKL